MTKQEQTLHNVDIKDVFINRIQIIRHVDDDDDVVVLNIENDACSDEFIIECLNNAFEAMSGLDKLSCYSHDHHEHYSLVLQTLPHY
jgi:hypothetical protein